MKLGSKLGVFKRRSTRKKIRNFFSLRAAINNFFIAGSFFFLMYVLSVFIYPTTIMTVENYIPLIKIYIFYTLFIASLLLIVGGYSLYIVTFPLKKKSLSKLVVGLLALFIVALVSAVRVDSLSNDLEIGARYINTQNCKFVRNVGRRKPLFTENAIVNGDRYSIETSLFYEAIEQNNGKICNGVNTFVVLKNSELVLDVYK